MYSKNDRAKNLVGLRQGSSFDFIPNFCPICGEYLKISEYNYFAWCPKCNIDIPEVLCYHGITPEQIKIFTDKFLDIVENMKSKTRLIGHYMEDMEATKLLAYSIINILKQEGEMEFRKFRFILFELYYELKDQNVDIKLPHYWYIDGPHIYLKVLPAVFKLRVKKSETDHKIYKVTILLDKRIKLEEEENDVTK